MGWGDAPDLQAWVDHSRLNIMRDLPARDDPAVPDLQSRLFESLFPALENLRVLARDVTPAEQSRIHEPPAIAG